MALTANTIVARVRQTLLDPAPGGTWIDDELIAHLNAGIAQLIALKPDALPTETDVVMVAGVAQSLGTNGVLFMDCLRNAAGNKVTVQPIHEFVRVRAGWAQDAQSANTEYVLFDPRLPRTFWVYPPAISETHLPVLQGTQPARVAALTDPIGVPDQWESALWTYVVACAYAKDGTRQDLEKTREFMKMFTDWINANTQVVRAMGAKSDIEGRQ